MVPHLSQTGRPPHAIRRRTPPHLRAGRCAHERANPWARLLPHRQTWAVSGARFLTHPIWWFSLFWLPGFFKARFHLGLSRLGLPLLLIHNMSAVGSIGGGWLPSLLARRRVTPARARLGNMLLCALAAVPMLFAARVYTKWAAIALLSPAVGAHQGWSTNLCTTISDIFPSGAVGSIIGIAGKAGFVGAALPSIGAGRMLERTHSYTPLFMLAGTVYLVALVLLQTLAPGLKRVHLEAR